MLRAERRPKLAACGTGPRGTTGIESRHGTGRAPANLEKGAGGRDDRRCNPSGLRTKVGPRPTAEEAKLVCLRADCDGKGAGRAATRGTRGSCRPRALVRFLRLLRIPRSYLLPDCCRSSVSFWRSRGCSSEGVDLRLKPGWLPGLDVAKPAAQSLFSSGSRARLPTDFEDPAGIRKRSLVFHRERSRTHKDRSPGSRGKSPRPPAPHAAPQALILGSYALSPPVSSAEPASPSFGWPQRQSRTSGISSPCSET